MHIGDMLGRRYRLDARVDGGAMGEVWRGTDTRLNRTVAVKVLHASLSTPAFRRRFAAEARAAAALRAPGVVDLYDYGEDTGDDDTSVSYLVMEFISGRALSAVLAEKGRMQPGDVMAMIGKCAEALEAAHKAGVIHRDIKPGNILLREDGGIKVVDFGIARAHGESGLTSTGQVMGTVAYVSPEQLYDETLTGASDIYSLGVVAYECLAGHKPFQAEAPAAIIRAQLSQTPPPLPSNVPDEVVQVVMRCLAKEPDKRWASGAELAKACRRLAARLPQGDSTEPMDSPDPDETSPVRTAAPVGGTATMPAQDKPATGSATPTVPPKSTGPVWGGLAGKKLVGAIAAAVLLLALVTTAAWRPWETSTAEPPPEAPTTGETSSDTRDPGDANTTDPGGYDDSGDWDSWDDSSSTTDETTDPSTPEPTDDSGDASDEPDPTGSTGDETDPDPTDDDSSGDNSGEPDADLLG